MLHYSLFEKTKPGAGLPPSPLCYGIHHFEGKNAIPVLLNAHKRASMPSCHLQSREERKFRRIFNWFLEKQ